MIAINGLGSTIAQALLPLLPRREAVHHYRLPGEAPAGCDRFLFAQGFLAGRTARAHDATSAGETFTANFLDIVAACDAIFEANEDARVVVIGSESGFTGSYDTAYAGAKAALHAYVETRRLKPRQQLVCVAPGIIGDSGMTERRTDIDALMERRAAHPKHRFICAQEVASLCFFLLYQDLGYLTGITIRMHGGQR